MRTRQTIENEAVERQAPDDPASQDLQDLKLEVLLDIRDILIMESSDPSLYQPEQIDDDD